MKKKMMNERWNARFWELAKVLLFETRREFFVYLKKKKRIFLVKLLIIKHPKLEINVLWIKTCTMFKHKII